jgi:hypothetical protein
MWWGKGRGIRGIRGVIVLKVSFPKDKLLNNVYSVHTIETE